jgi:mannose-1-phosphate guanylyltransferase
VIVGQCESVDSRSNVVVSEGRLTALIGVEDLVVVHAGKATLICPKSRAQDVKLIVQRLSENEEYRKLL